MKQRSARDCSDCTENGYKLTVRLFLFYGTEENAVGTPEHIIIFCDCVPSITIHTAMGVLEVKEGWSGSKFKPLRTLYKYIILCAYVQIPI